MDLKRRESVYSVDVARHGLYGATRIEKSGNDSGLAE
jgi:hypothetical protein